MSKSPLYINKRLHGQVINSQYLTQPLLSEYFPSLNTQPSNDHAPINTDATTSGTHLTDAGAQSTDESSTPLTRDGDTK